MSAAGKSVLPVAKWCATVRTSTGCICGQLARTASSLLFDTRVDHKYVVRISKDKVVSRDTEVVDPLC